MNRLYLCGAVAAGVAAGGLLLYAVVSYTAGDGRSPPASRAESATSNTSQAVANVTQADSSEGLRSFLSGASERAASTFAGLGSLLDGVTGSAPRK